MRDDPIVNEVRRVRETHAERFNYDLQAIYLDLKNQERMSGKEFLSYAPRRLSPLEHGKAPGDVQPPPVQPA